MFIEDDCDRGATSVEGSLLTLTSSQVQVQNESLTLHLKPYPYNGGAPCFPTKPSENLS